MEELQRTAIIGSLDQLPVSHHKVAVPASGDILYEKQGICHQILYLMFF